MNDPVNRIDPTGTRDARFPDNGSIKNDSSQPVIILNSTKTGDYLETLQPGQPTPDALGLSKDADGVWVCQQHRWAFYGVSVGRPGRLGFVSVPVPVTVGRGSLFLPIITIFLSGDVVVTDKGVYDKAIGNLTPTRDPATRGRESSRTPPGGKNDCSCIKEIARRYPDASIWKPVLPGDEDPDNLLERR